MSGKDSSFALFLLLQQSTFNMCLGSLVSSAIFAPWHMAVNNPCNSSNPVKPCQTFNWCHGCHGCHHFFGQVSHPSTRCEKMEKLDIKSSNNNKQLDSTRAPKVLCSFFRISVLKRVSQSSKKTMNKQTSNIPQFLSVTVLPQWILHHVFTAHCVLDFCEAPASEAPKAGKRIVDRYIMIYIWYRMISSTNEFPFGSAQLPTGC